MKKPLLYLSVFLYSTLIYGVDANSPLLSLEIRYNADGYTRRCQVEFYSVNNSHELAGIKKNNIQLTGEFGESFRLQLHFQNELNQRRWLPDEVEITFNENAPSRSSIKLNKPSNGDYFFEIINSSGYDRPNDVLITFSSSNGYRGKIKVPVIWSKGNLAGKDPLADFQHNSAPITGNTNTITENRFTIKQGYIVHVDQDILLKPLESFPGLENLGELYWVRIGNLYDYRLGTFQKKQTAERVRVHALSQGYPSASISWEAGSNDSNIFGESTNTIVRGSLETRPTDYYKDAILIIPKSSYNYTARSPVSVGSYYYIQVMASRHPQNERDYSPVSQYGQISIIYQGGLHKVQIGAFSTLQETQTVLSELKRYYEDAFIVKR